MHPSRSNITQRPPFSSSTPMPRLLAYLRTQNERLRLQHICKCQRALCFGLNAKYDHWFSVTKQDKWPSELINYFLDNAVEAFSPADVEEQLRAAAHSLRRRQLLVPPAGVPLQVQGRPLPPRGAGSVACSILVDVDQALAQSCRGGLRPTG